MEIIFDMPTSELKKAMENKVAEWAKQQDVFKQQQEKLDDEEK
tara:strand:- start:172 stop:300 length:129 start_codon:yes stop_codon:yes gene_type:complete